MKNHHLYDKAYKYLLSNPFILRELLETFVKEDWIKLIDFKKVENLNTSFISDEFKKKESDIIFKLKLKSKDIYLYLLIEFQSTVDQFISVRVLRYILEFYEYLIKNKNVKKLPVVFPIVLYNGNEKWTAPINISNLIDCPIQFKDIKQFLPDFKYFKIIENEFSIKDLEKINNIISTIFLIENATSEKISDILKHIKNRVQNENISAIRAFYVWLQNYLNNNASIEVIEKTINKIRDLEEVKTMLATTLEKWEHKLIDKGKKEGFEEGIEKNTKQIAIKMLDQKYNLSDISMITGLSENIIKTLKK